MLCCVVCCVVLCCVLLRCVLLRCVLLRCVLCVVCCVLCFVFCALCVGCWMSGAVSCVWYFRCGMRCVVSGGFCVARCVLFPVSCAMSFPAIKPVTFRLEDLSPPPSIDQVASVGSSLACLPRQRWFIQVCCRTPSSVCLAILLLM